MTQGPGQGGRFPGSDVRNPRVLISGAGIAGPSLAHWLLRYGFEPTLIERAPAFRAGGYMIDVWGTGYDILERYGLLETGRQRGYRFDRLKFVDVRGRERSRLGAEVFRAALGGRFFSIPRSELARTIYETIEGRVPLLYGTSIRTLHQDAGGIELELSTGETHRFDLLVGADGLHSRVRELAFVADPLLERYLGYIAASFTTEGYPHRDEGVYVSYARPGRQVSRYAMRGGRSAFLFVFAEKDRERIPSHDSLAQRTLVRSRFSGDGWEVPEILARLETAEDFFLDAVSQIRMPRWTSGRVALVGDAAYSPSLLAGAGAAFAMLGAYVLAQALHAADGSFASAFAIYELKLRPFMRRQQAGAARFASSFTPGTELGLAVRDRVLQLMRIPAIGTWLARRMLGGSYPLPDADRSTARGSGSSAGSGR